MWFKLPFGELGIGCVCLQVIKHSSPQKSPQPQHKSQQILWNTKSSPKIPDKIVIIWVRPPPCKQWINMDKQSIKGANTNLHGIHCYSVGGFPKSL